MDDLDTEDSGDAISGEDDLFGDAPAAPAEVEEPAEDIGDMFGDTPAPSEPETVPFTEPAPADDDMEDLFGGDASTPAPAEEPAAVDEPAPADDSLEDMFGDPPAGDEEPAGGDDLEDMFGDPPAGDEEPAGGDDLEDLFGKQGSEKILVKAQHSNLRVWQDNTGTFRTMGELKVIARDHVRILKENGRYCTVPLQRLSSTDFQLVQQIAGNYGKSVVRLAER
jgi:hypothetical protein